MTDQPKPLSDKSLADRIKDALGRDEPPTAETVLGWWLRADILTRENAAMREAAGYGEAKLREGYESEADVEKLLAQTLGAPSAHRSFEAFAAEKLAAWRKAAGETK